VKDLILKTKSNSFINMGEEGGCGAFPLGVGFGVGFFECESLGVGFLGVERRI
jgi:hypothetical protein